jgi:hypothetical protein
MALPLAVTEAALGPDHPITATRLNHLAEIRRRLEQDNRDESP